MPLNTPLESRVFGRPAGRPASASEKACFRKPQESSGTPEGPATGLSGVVHKAANEFTPGGLRLTRRGQPRDSVSRRLRRNASSISADRSLLRLLLGAISHCVSLKKKVSMQNKLARLSALGATLVASTGAFAQAVNPVDAIAAVTSLQGSATGFGPVMFGLAVAVVGIMIGVKWIKRAKGAA